MISERKFATEFASVWRAILPLSDSFVRTMNAQRERYLPAHRATYSSEMGGYVSELGFQLFVAIQNGQIKPSSSGGIRIDARFSEISERVWLYIKRLPGQQESSTSVPTRAEQKEAIVLATRLVDFFKSRGVEEPMLVQPRFEGCGLVDACFGDVLAGDTLWEIKNVGRDFRAIDFRQLLIYCALEKASSKRPIKQVGLLNARQGVFLRTSLEELSVGISGLKQSDLLSNITDWISMEQTSR